MDKCRAEPFGAYSSTHLPQSVHQYPSIHYHGSVQRNTDGRLRLQRRGLSCCFCESHCADYLFGMEDQCVCHSQLIDEPIAQQLPPANRDSVRLISMSYRLEKGSSYLMQSPAVQAYFSSRVSRLTTLFFRGDFDVFLFVQGIIHSSGSTLEKLDVMLYNCESNHS